jgi:hypothetical protein
LVRAQVRGWVDAFVVVVLVTGALLRVRGAAT